jgi:hypothetical protein
VPASVVNVCNPNSLNAFKSVEALHTAIFGDELLEAYFWEQSTSPYYWNSDWTHAAREGGGLDINDPVFILHCSLD